MRGMRKWKRWAVFLLLFAVLAVGGSRTAQAEMLDMTKYNDDLITVSKVPHGKAGNKISIKMTVHNNGSKGDNYLRTIRLANADQYDQFYTYDDDDDDSDSDSNISWSGKHFPFEADSNTFKEKRIDVKPGSSKSVTLTYKLRRDLAAGYYQAFFYIDDSLKVGINIWVSAYDGSSTEEDDNTKLDYDFSIGDNQQTPYAGYNQVMNFGVNLTNTGLKKVYDVRVDMQLDADITKFPFDINEGNYNRKMGDMEPGQMVTVPYSMMVRENVKSGFFPIHYLVTYREEEGGEFSDPVDKVFYVRVKGKDDDELSADAGEQDRTKSRIIVDSFETIPAEIYAGQPFELRVRMKNASSDVSASNIMFTFASEEVENTPIFTSESGSTSVVVNNMAPGATADLSMVFKAAPTAEQKSYRITIQEQYDSPEFKNAKEEVKIALPVKQEPRLNTSTIDVMPDAIEVGSETNVMFGINNTGKVILYNVMARFEADSIQPADAYVGNIKPGETGNVDTMLTAIAPTTDDGKVKIIISYEDENGVVSETEKEMLLNVSEAVSDDGVDGMDGMGDGMDADADAPQAGGTGRIALVLVIAALVGAGIGVLVWKRKKKKMAAEKALENDLDEELDSRRDEPEITTYISENEKKEVDEEETNYQKGKKK
ncbi:COG1361 S-layer family protein [Clostridium fessum]|uniref:COG1361 S-layer family protein n=1 Tax=Clostridium fessum TaxID=2126740 RepID=UPI0022E8CDDD|nr:CARDB domain-containing protein [Clostridium fessum]